MNINIRLAIFDLDGTLLNTDNLEDLRKNKEWKKTYERRNEVTIIKDSFLLLKKYKELGYLIAIVTNAKRKEYLSTLNTVFSLEADILVGFEDFKEAKPSYKPYLLAIEKIEQKGFSINIIEIIGNEIKDIEAGLNLKAYYKIQKINKVIFLFLINIKNINEKKEFIEKNNCKIIDEDYLNIFLKIKKEELYNHLYLFKYYNNFILNNYNYISEIDKKVHSLIIDFKENGYHIDILAELIINKIFENGFYNNTLIIPTPSSKKEFYKIRYKKLFEYLKKYPNIISGYGVVTIKNDCENSKSGNRCKDNFNLQINDFILKNIEIEKIKNIIILDDVWTTGSTYIKMLMFLKNIFPDKFFSSLVIGKTVYNKTSKEINQLIEKGGTMETNKIYNIDECLYFTYIYSQVKGDGGFFNFKHHNDVFFELFKNSIIMSKNIFKMTSDEKNKFLNDTIISLKEKKKNIQKIEERLKQLEDFFIDEKKIKSIFELLNEEKKLCIENNIRIISYFDEEYPECLKKIETPPFVLFCKGKFLSEKILNKTIAIIGTRNPENLYAEKCCKKIAEVLKTNGWFNVSGLAEGCDTFGHKNTIGYTGAVLGQGLATEIYPSCNIKLAEEILNKDGFLLSEVLPSSKSISCFFTERDRLQSALSRAVFVIECSLKSGTLHTINFALKQNKKVFVLNPKGIKNVNEIKEFSGNLMLLDKENSKYNSNVKFSVTRKEKIIGIEKINIDLPRELKVIDKENIKESKIIDKYIQEKLI